MVLAISYFSAHSIDGTVSKGRMAAQSPVNPTRPDPTRPDPTADGVANADRQAYGHTMGGTAIPR
ncbi:hypothetical protein [Komagataeibacter medellinensis]|uniref:hypothetical protein n=1 Tax=Komagataeibacter medellinensis TaxID=1177712 RepID=UPI001E5E80AF|nr:hypothetical protein [Komagataeibacter medellinensis]